MKRLFRIILAVVLVVASLTSSLSGIRAKAKPAVIASGYCGIGLTWEYTDDQKLTISGTGATGNYASGGAPWYIYRDKITSIVVKEGATRLGDAAFESMTKVKSITLPSTLTSIGNSTFSCTDIVSMKLPENLLEIGEEAFKNCFELKTINIPESVYTIGEMAFESCTELTSIVIPGLVTLGEKVFSNCTRLQSIVIQAGFTELPKGLLQNCLSLTCVILPKSITVIGEDVFANCRGLKRITLSGATTSIGEGAFSDCWSLAEIYYDGSKAEWNEIDIGRYNEPLSIAKIYYDSYNPFVDVSAGEWYFKTVLWAYDHNITSGTSATTFEPDKTCTRAEFVTFLYKLMGKPWDPSWASECSFSDVKPSNWYYRAAIWANHTGVTHGMGGKFQPNTVLDRGMVISFLYNMSSYLYGKPEITLTKTKFTDVSKSSYYYIPVLWAEQYKITNGTSATTFSPAKKCTRAEAVTFIYNMVRYWDNNIV